MRKIDLHIHTRASSLDAHFNFSQSKLDEYIEKAALDGIAITNHNLFDEGQFREIRESVQIPTFPGIEVSLEKGQILVISDGQDVSTFAAACEKVAQRCAKVGECLTLQEFEHIFGDLKSYLLIPHYEKKPPISDDLLSHLAGAITAGEVSSPKKFMYCMNGADRLVPVYFSDCRMKDDLSGLPVRQTYVDCNAVSFNAIRECLRDKNKVALSKSDGNKLFQVLENGQHISTGLNVVLGDRSSGKSHTLGAIKRRFPNVHHIEQFALVARDESDDEKRFARYLSQNQGLFSKEYLAGLQRVIEDVVDIDLDSDDREIEKYIASLLAYARETERHDAFSKAKLYDEDPFPDRSQEGLTTLVSSTKNLISNVEFREVVEKHVARSSIINLYLELMNLYSERQKIRLKKRWVNDLLRDIKSHLQRSSAAPKIADVDLYNIALNKRKIAKFEQIAKRTQRRSTPLRRRMRGFSVVASVSPFTGAGEMSAVIRRQIALSNAYKEYERPYNFLQKLKEIGAPLEQGDFAKCFVKIHYQILNKDGYAASGGERSEFFLLDKIESADEHEMLLIDEPESSFDNNFLNEDVNAIIKEMSRKMPVVVVTHNNTVGASIKPDYLVYTNKEFKDGEIVWRTYSGFPTDSELTSPDGMKVKTWNVLMGNLEAGSRAYEERRQTYENLRNS